MNNNELNAVTGAFGYTGKYITRRLLAQGKKVITLTGSPDRPNPFGERVKAHSFNFKQPEALVQTLQGVTVLYNTYWVRFNHGAVTFDLAVENTKILIQAAKDAGVRRFVHVSITNPSSDSPLPYFRGKGMLEQNLKQSGLSHAIIRPAVIFGKEDILINNIAHLLRRFPVFAIPGSGNYRLQPVYVDDMAEVAIQAGEKRENLVVDAVGPEVYTFNELVQLIASTTNSRAKIVHLPPFIFLFLSRLIGYFVNDVVLTKNEIRGLMANLLVSNQSPTGDTSLRSWLVENADILGRQYVSELTRHYK